MGLGVRIVLFVRVREVSVEARGEKEREMVRAMNQGVARAYRDTHQSLRSTREWFLLSALLSSEDVVSRGKGDIAEHAHVPECFGTHNQVVRAAPELDTICATRACLQMVCGHLVMEKWGQQGKGQVRTQKKSSGVRGTHPLSTQRECGHCHCTGMQCGVVQRWQQ